MAGQSIGAARVLLLASFFASALPVTAEEMPWGNGYPEYLPDINRLHGRLHAHEGGTEGKRNLDSSIKPVKQVTPEFPRDAVNECRNGWVLIEFLVDANGMPGDIEIVAQDFRQLFGESAARALKKWRFEPAVENGQAVPQKVTIPFVFQRPDCSGVYAPAPHSASLVTEFDLPVDSGDIQAATIVFMPAFKKLIGAPEGGYVHAQEWVNGDIIPMDFKRMAADVLVQRSGWRRARIENGLKLNPHATRFARVVPVVVSTTAKDGSLKPYFSDSSGRDLALVYVDRASTLKGARGIGTVAVDYKLEFPGPGFYWVEFRVNKGGNGFEAVLADNLVEPRLALSD